MSELEFKAIELPSGEEILRRLRQLDNDPVTERLYPFIIQNVHGKRNGIGIVNRLIFAIQQYVDGMAPEMMEAMLLLLPEYVNALVDDEEVRSDALRWLSTLDF